MAFIFVVVLGILMADNAVSAGIPQCHKVFVNEQNRSDIGLYHNNFVTNFLEDMGLYHNNFVANFL